MAKLDTSATNKVLFKNTGIIAIGQISTRIVNFFLLPLYTALLSTKDYGLADLLTTYSGLISILIGLQMHQAIFRFLVTKRNDKTSIKRTVSSVFGASILIFIAYSVIFILIQPYINLQCKWFLLAHVLCTISLNTMSGVSRGLGNNTAYAIGNFVASVAILILNVIAIAVLHLGVAGMLVSYIIGPALGTLYIFFRCRILQYTDFNMVSKEELKGIIHYSIPLVPNELSWSVIHSSDRWVVSFVLSIAANGLIAVASKFSLIYTTLFSIFNASWTEQVVLHYKDEGGPEYVNEMFDKMITFFATLAIVIIACMPFVFRFLVNKQFSEAYGLVPFYMIAVYFNAIVGMLSAIYLIENETKQIAVSTTVAAFINLLVDVLLIKIVGVYAAPISSICGYAAISIWRLIDINKRHCKISIRKKNLIGIMLMLIISLCAYFAKNTIIEAFGLLFVVGLAIYFNYSFMKKLWERVLTA